MAFDAHPFSPPSWAPDGGVAPLRGRARVPALGHLSRRPGARPRSRTAAASPARPRRDLATRDPFLDFLVGLRRADRLVGGGGPRLDRRRPGRRRARRRRRLGRVVRPRRRRHAARRRRAGRHPRPAPGATGSTAGPGNDVVRVRDGWRDVVRCGAGPRRHRASPTGSTSSAPRLRARRPRVASPCGRDGPDRGRGAAPARGARAGRAAGVEPLDGEHRPRERAHRLQRDPGRRSACSRSRSATGGTRSSSRSSSRTPGSGSRRSCARSGSSTGSRRSSRRTRRSCATARRGRSRSRTSSRATSCASRPATRSSPTGRS